MTAGSLLPPASLSLLLKIFQMLQLSCQLGNLFLVRISFAMVSVLYADNLVLKVGCAVNLTLSWAQSSGR